VTRLFRFDRSVASAVESYGSQSTASVHLGSGSGESHAYVLHFEAGGEIGEHETGFGQLFVVVGGAGWVVSGSDRYEVELGDAVFLPRGVMHAKGSESGMTAVMIQMYDLEPGQESRSGPGSLRLQAE
jgi:quercetin dioxygenase-like cupin family protein